MPQNIHGNIPSERSLSRFSSTPRPGQNRDNFSPDLGNAVIFSGNVHNGIPEGGGQEIKLTRDGSEIDSLS